MQDIERIIRIYKKRMDLDETLPALAEQHTAQAAEQYAAKLGEHMAKAIVASAELAGMSEEEAKPFMRTLLEQVHKDASKVARIAQEAINRAAGTGLAPLVADFDSGLSDIISEDIAGRELAEGYVVNQLANHAISGVDNTFIKNAGAHERLGLSVHIVRRYSGHGLHDGKDPCEWCIARAGEWTSNAAAKAAGAFERHPGCLCTIEYESRKTHTVQSRGGMWTDV